MEQDLTSTNSNISQNGQHDPDICPRCGSRRSLIKEMYSEPSVVVRNSITRELMLIATPNHISAIRMMAKCQECYDAIMPRLEKEHALKDPR